jgi:hypothetical protein
MMLARIDPALMGSSTVTGGNTLEDLVDPEQPTTD